MADFNQKAQVLRPSSPDVGDLLATVLRLHRRELERSAGRILGDFGMAEDILQEACLYTLASGVELTTELDVLKFVKWKTANLARDYIRVRNRTVNYEPGSMDELESPIPSPAQQIVNADHAAVVQLALMKLSERNRALLLAQTLSDAEKRAVQKKFGLGQNAYRQALMRARQAFKSELEVESANAGFGLGDILFGKVTKVLTSVGAALFVLVFIGSGLANTFSLRASVANNDLPPAGISLGIQGTLENKDSKVSPLETRIETSTELADGGEYFAGSTDELRPSSLQQESIVTPGDSNIVNLSQSPIESNEKDESRESKIEMLSTFMANLAVAGDSIATSTFQERPSESIENLVLDFGNGLVRIRLMLDQSSENLVQYFECEVSDKFGRTFFAYPTSSLEIVESQGTKQVIHFAATDFLVGDFSGDFDFSAVDFSTIAPSTISLELIVDPLTKTVEGRIKEIQGVNS